MIIPGRLLVSWVLAATVGVQAGDDGVFKGRETFIPRNALPATPGTQIMVLVADVESFQPLGQFTGAYNHYTVETRRFSQACLSADASRYRWIWMPVDQDPSFSRKVPLGGGAEPRLYPKLREVKEPELLRWGIKEKYQLVEVEVNDGLGSPKGEEGFVVTKLKILDGTKDFPLKVADTVATLRKKYDEWLAEAEPDVRTALDGARTQVATMKPDPSSGKNVVQRRPENRLIYATWMNEARRLEVRFMSRIEGGVFVGAQGRSGNVQFKLPSFAWGVDLGMSYEVGASGRLEKGRKLAPEFFTAER